MQITNLTLNKPIVAFLSICRDGRTLIGYLRSVDQFANLVLHRCIERVHVGNAYGDVQRGLYMVRGENVVLLGEVDEEKEANWGLEERNVTDILELQHKEQAEKEEKERIKAKVFKERGLTFAAEVTPDDNY